MNTNKRYCVTNYTMGCIDVTSGETGCFLFDVPHYKATGEFKAVSPIYPSLIEFYAKHRAETRGEFIECDLP